MAIGEIACFEQFLLLSQRFQMSSAAEASESVYMWERVNMIVVYSIIILSVHFIFLAYMLSKMSAADLLYAGEG